MCVTFLLAEIVASFSLVFFRCFEIIWWLKVSHGKQEDFPVSPPLHTLHLSLSPSPPPLFLPSSAYKSNYDGCATDWGLKWVRFQLSPFSRKTGDSKSRDWQLPRPLSTLFPPLRCFNVSKQREITAGPTNVILARIVANCKLGKGEANSRLANANNWKLGLYPSSFTTHLLCLHFIIKQKWYVLILKCPQICCQEKLWHDLKS